MLKLKLTDKQTTPLTSVQRRISKDKRTAQVGIIAILNAVLK